MKLFHPRRLSISLASLLLLGSITAVRAQPPAAKRPVVRYLGPQRVITLPTVRTEKEGIAAEHWWTRKNFPGYRWKEEKLIQDTKRRIYDRVTLLNKQGQEATIYFDITNWYGHS